MLTPNHIYRYQIENIWNRVAGVDYLFRGTRTESGSRRERDFGELMNFDPYDEAERDLAENWPDKKAELTVAIGPYGSVIIQTIIFRTPAGYQNYLDDNKENNIILFNEKKA